VGQARPQFTIPEDLSLALRTGRILEAGGYRAAAVSIRQISPLTLNRAERSRRPAAH